MIDTKNFKKNNEGGFQIDEDAAMKVPELEQEEEKSTLTVQIFEWIDVISTALIIVVLVFSLLFRVATIDGKSMESTLFNGEKVIITNLAYHPSRGDVVVIYREDNTPIIKRVIALPGETVDIHDGKVFVNNEAVPLVEEYLDDSVATFVTEDTNVFIRFPATVPSGKVFVLGDNRMVSHDSRYKDIGGNGDGMIDQDDILGHAILRIFPFNKFGGLN